MGLIRNLEDVGVDSAALLLHFSPKASTLMRHFMETLLVCVAVGVCVGLLEVLSKTSTGMHLTTSASSTQFLGQAALLSSVRLNTPSSGTGTDNGK